MLESLAVFLRGYVWEPAVERRQPFRRDACFGVGAVARLGELALGAARVAAIVSPSLPADDLRRVERALGRPLTTLVRAAGPLTDTAVSSLLDELERIRPDLLVGVGGGTVLDVAKATARRLECRLVLVPTTLSGAEHTSNAAIWVGGRKTVNRVEPAHAVVADPDLLVRQFDLLGPTALHAVAHTLTIRRDRTLGAPSLAALALAALDDVLLALEDETLDDGTPLRFMRGAWNAAVAIGLTGPKFGPHHLLAHRLVRPDQAHARVSATVLCATLLASDLYDDVVEQLPIDDAASRLRRVAERWLERLDLQELEPAEVDVRTFDEEWRADCRVMLEALGRV